MRRSPSCRINEFLAGARLYVPGDDEVSEPRQSLYEGDFGLCRVAPRRGWVPADTVLLLDSSRVQVMPLALARSFHYKPLAAAGDSETGMVIGEYTVEFKNENAHGLIRGLAT